MGQCFATSISCLFCLIQRKTCVLTEQRKSGGKKAFLKEKGKTNAGECVKRCIALLPSHGDLQPPTTVPMEAMEADAPVICWAGTSEEDAEQECEWKGGLGVIQEARPPPSSKFPHRPVAPIRVLCSSFSIFSLFPCFFPLVKCITGTSDVSEYCTFVTPRTSTRASEHPEPQKTEESPIYY